MTEGEASSSPIRRIGRYALYTEIASGGMATVYLGRQRGQAGFARTVAIKRLHPQHAKEPDFVAMFLDEARLAARIRHPNVVPTLDVVATEGELFLVMEYVQGESLARLLKASRHRKEDPPTRVVAAIVADVLHGLHAAHEATSEKGEPLGLVHRDVSPHNVLVGTDGVARVVDFGVAKAAGRIQTTREGQLKGKIAYMAPEQITGVASRKTDVYAASVVLWEALTTRRLFTGENDANVMNQVMNAKIAPPSQHREGLEPVWDDIVLRGLERDEEKRWASAREMALEIESKLQLARATEVGAWVESLAHESLVRRAADVTAVESASDVELVPAEPESVGSAPSGSSLRPSVLEPAAGAGESTGSKLSVVSSPLSVAPGPKNRTRRTVALVGAGAGVVGVLAWVAIAMRSSSPPPEAAKPAPSDIATIPAPASAPPPPPAVLASSSAAAPASAPPLVTAAVAGAKPPSRPSRPAHGSPASPSAATKSPSLGSLLDTRR
ncbi:MAG TPA: serine/threonine-protein kinase [Polyangiaceae bacterium]|jgi:serine/threonine-protein kinase